LWLGGDICVARHKVCLPPREARFLVVFGVTARGGRPGSGAKHIFIGSGNQRLSWDWRHLIVGAALDGVQLQEEVLKVCGDQGGGCILEKSWGLKVAATGLDPKPAIAKGIRSGLMVVLPMSSMLWMAMDLL
jgi:hypothetical protein